jgi:cystathionine beta-lyase
LVEKFVAIEAPVLATSANSIEATFLAWLDGRVAGWADPAEALLRHGLGVSNGREFGVPGFFRLNFGCPRSLLEEGLDRLRAGLAGKGSLV